jgi:hypothetical protein
MDFLTNLSEKTILKSGRLSDKQVLKDKIEQLKNSSNNTIEVVIELAHSLGIVKKDDKLNTYIRDNEEQFNNAKIIQYREIQNLYRIQTRAFSVFNTTWS